MSSEFNVLDFWKDFYNQSSSYFDDKVMESFPSQGIGQILEMNLQFKKMLDESTERYLQLANVPSRKDIAHLSSQIVNVDAKVDSLEELLETRENQETFQQDLKSLKSDMQNLDQKLNQILALLGSK